MRLNYGLSLCLASISVVSALPTLPPADAVHCVADNETQALQITANCIDPDYSSSVILSDTNETHPVPHRRVVGHFNGTDIDFSVCLTPKPQWKGRFFQLFYPTQNAIPEDYAIAFGVESGGYTVQASGSMGYRADAAVAKLSRQIAQEYYNIPSSDHIYGYFYGGSGGSLKAIGAAENTFGVWDGCVALIQATPISIPYNWGIRALGGFVFANHSEELIDAVQPGGIGHHNLSLDDAERVVLEETEALGIPIKGWEDWSGIVGNRTQQWQTLKDIAVPMIQDIDPTYADDFWTKDGYAGHEQSALGERFRSGLIQFDSDIETAMTGEDGLTSEFTLTNIPEDVADVVGLGFSVTVDNTTQPFSGTLDAETRTIYILAGAAETALKALTPGANVRVDNRWYLAAHTYHRHQLSTPDSGFYAQDYLRDENGDPRYPQRAFPIGPSISQASAGGGTHTGNITMKTIVMNTLLDFDAFPWHADWYKNQVRAAKGDLEDHYRLYYSDNADHTMGRIKAPQTSRVVDFTGLYEQHLRDLSAWVEDGVSPPPPTEYTVDTGRVEVPSLASERKGIQPVVDLFAGCSRIVHTTPGQSVNFSVTVQTPSGTGEIVTLEWDPYGLGEFTKKDIEVGSEVDLQFSFSYEEPGVYFAGIRAASHRDGRTDTEAALAWNLDRVRVVVE